MISKQFAQRRAGRKRSTEIGYQLVEVDSVNSSVKVQIAIGPDFAALAEVGRQRVEVDGIDGAVQGRVAGKREGNQGLTGASVLVSERAAGSRTVDVREQKLLADNIGDIGREHSVVCQIHLAYHIPGEIHRHGDV